ncbi:MAG: hydrogenase expression/formation protein HypE [Gammaproteobacteria bacterium]|nr:hydrogenase expression/formation protein HypE [Gammaproteobacteria bacterium]
MSCPLPSDGRDRITLAHGSGGRLTRRLVEEIFAPAFHNALLAPLCDAAVWTEHAGRLAFTTDAYVVSPLVFPGGDIGHLAVCGTVNDLAMMGARPKHLSAAFVLEEGLPLAVLKDLVRSMAACARDAGVAIVTGDTKVVERGKGDGLYVTTAGVGVCATATPLGPSMIADGDVVIVNGDLGRHGMAIMAHRAGLEFDEPLLSDVACLHEPVLALIEAGIPLHCLRDLTRGGLATAVVELAQASARGVVVDGKSIAVSRPVAAACDLLGLDPLYVANEGRFVACVPASAADAALAVLHAHPLAREARVVGRVGGVTPGWAVLETPYGTRQKLDLLSGDQLPRIC